MHTFQTVNAIRVAITKTSLAFSQSKRKHPIKQSKVEQQQEWILRNKKKSKKHLIVWLKISIFHPKLLMNSLAKTMAHLDLQRKYFLKKGQISKIDVIYSINTFVKSEKENLKKQNQRKWMINISKKSSN